MRHRLFASLLLPVQHQHDVHEPEAFSVWRLQLGQDFAIDFVSNRLLQVLEAVCLLWHLATNFMPYIQDTAWPGSCRGMQGMDDSCLKFGK